MLSYRHSYHAGNFADVIKHIVQIEILQHLIKKESAFDYIDTHAGAGLYNLQSKHATKLEEYTQGIGKLNAEDWPELKTYFDILSKHNPSGNLNCYPGSPFVAMHFLRGKDRSWLYELHPTDAEQLKKNIGNSKRVRVIQEDGFKGLLSLLPPVSRRALVVIDPSYEIKSDYSRLVETLTKAYKKFPSGIYAAWYPVVDRRTIDNLQRKFIRSGIKNIQRFELGIHRDKFESGLSASGMIIINSPWTLKHKMLTILPKLVNTLGGEGAFYKCDEWVSE